MTTVTIFRVDECIPDQIEISGPLSQEFVLKTLGYPTLEDLSETQFLKTYKKNSQIVFHYYDEDEHFGDVIFVA